MVKLLLTGPLRRGLHQNPESAAKMFGMREGLKLPRAGTVPFAQSSTGLGLRQDLCQESCLRQKAFRRQAGGFTGFLAGGEIDVRRQILFAGVGQNIAGDLMPVIGPQRAIQAGR